MNLFMACSVWATAAMFGTLMMIHWWRGAINVYTAWALRDERNRSKAWTEEFRHAARWGVIHWLLFIGSFSCSYSLIHAGLWVLNR